MKTYHKNYFIAVLFLMFITVSCKEESKEDNSCDDLTSGDCGKIVLSDDGRLLCPKWLVHVMDSLEEEAITLSKCYVYQLQAFEYQQQTYIQYNQPSSSAGIPAGYFTCTGVHLGWLFPYQGTITYNHSYITVIFQYCNGSSSTTYRYVDPYAEHAVDDETIADCREEIVITDGKLLSPGWLVSVIDSLENQAITLNDRVQYKIEYRECNKQRIITIFSDSWFNQAHDTVQLFYYCSGIEIKEGEMWVSLRADSGVYRTTLFYATFCYAPECEEKKSEIHY